MKNKNVSDSDHREDEEARSTYLNLEILPKRDQNPQRNTIRILLARHNPPIQREPRRRVRRVRNARDEHRAGDGQVEGVERGFVDDDEAMSMMGKGERGLA